MMVIRYYWMWDKERNKPDGIRIISNWMGYFPAAGKPAILTSSL